MVKVSDWQAIQDLIAKHGNISLGALANILKQGREHLCPKCKGRGIEKYSKPYPSGFPDSGFVPDTIEERQCQLCNGVGWTSVEYQPVSEVVRYEAIK